MRVGLDLVVHSEGPRVNLEIHDNCRYTAGVPGIFKVGSWQQPAGVALVTKVDGTSECQKLSSSAVPGDATSTGKSAMTGM